MAQVLIRGLDDETVKRLKDRAQRHGRSLQAEARLILTQVAGLGFNDARKLARQWHSKLCRRDLPDSTESVREDRQR